MNRKRIRLNNTQSDKNFQSLLSKINHLLLINNIYFLIEPNAKYYGCNYLYNSKQTLKFVKKTKLSNVFINIDTGNANLEKDKINFDPKDQLYVKNIQISEKNLKGLSKKIITVPNSCCNVFCAAQLMAKPLIEAPAHNPLKGTPY